MTDDLNSREVYSDLPVIFLYVNNYVDNFTKINLVGRKNSPIFVLVLSQLNQFIMTQFEMAVAQAEMGTLELPSVQYGSNPIDYFWYQLRVHHFNLKLMAKGLKFRGVKLSDMKAYYGLKGRSAADCLPQFEQIIAKFDVQSELN